MIDHKVSSLTALGLLLWLLGFALIAWDLFTVTDLGELGLYAACAGGVLNIRSFFCQLAQRERNAFEAGREYEEGKRLRAMR